MITETKLSRKTKETGTGMRGEKVYGMCPKSVIKLYDKVLIDPVPCVMSITQQNG